MTAEQNKQLIEQLSREVFGDGNIDRVDDLYADDYVEHGSLGDIEGLDAHRENIRQFLEAFSMGKPVSENIIADEHRVSYCYRTEAKHTGEFLGIEPTNETIETAGCATYRVENGKIVEGWHHNNLLQVLMQLGGVELSEPVSQYMQKSVEEPSPRTTPPDREEGRRPRA